MRALRSRLAILLLLCFTRVLLPDVWLLALHPHQHTTDEPAHASTPRAPGKAHLLLTAKHQHCQTDHFNRTFVQLTRPLEITAVVAFSASQEEWLYTHWLSSPVATGYLRGPPNV